MPSRPSPPPFLLFRQTALLCALAGMLTAFTPWPALAFFLLLCLYNLPRRPRLPLLLILCGAFALGAAYAQFRAIEEPLPPPLLRQVAERYLLPQTDRAALPPVFVRATVASPTVLPDGRIRATLEGVTLEQEGADGSVRESYHGKILWIWHEPRGFVQAGDSLHAQVTITPLRGLANPGTWDTKEYWNLQGVFFRATSNAKAAVHVQRPAFGLSPLYKTLYARFLLALPAEDGTPLRQLAATTNATPHTHPLLREYAALRPRAMENAGKPEGIGPQESGGSLPASSLRPSPGAGLLPALLFGDHSFLSQEQTDRIARSTLAHSLALSGLHLAYAVILGMGCAQTLGFFAPRLWIRWRRQTVALICAVPFALAYLWLGQAPLSLLRAACMLFFWVLLIFLHRPKVLLDGLLAAMAVLALFDPAALANLGLQLSALSIVVIALCLPLVRRATDALCAPKRPAVLPKGAADQPSPGRVRRVTRGAITILLLSLCIQVALLPLVVSAFGTVGLWFPLNVVWLPVLGALVMPPAFAGLVAAACGLTGTAHALLTLASRPCDLLLWALGFMDTHGLLLAPVVYRPGWVFWAGFWLICLYLPVWWLQTGETAGHSGTSPAARRHNPAREPTLWRQRARGLFLTRGGGFLCLGAALCAGAIAWSTWWRVPPGVGLRLLDVGHGQAVLVEWRLPEGTGRVLIDGGSLANTGASMGKIVVMPTLTAGAWPAVDGVINSHPDTDHLGGLLYVLGNLRVDAYAGNGIPPAGPMAEQERAALAASGLRQRVLSRGQTLALSENLLLEVLWPPPTDHAESPRKARNDASLLLRLVWQGKPLALFCGDLERPALKALMEKAGAALSAETERPADSVPAETKKPGALHAEVLVLPHHGSHNSLLPAFYDAVSPKAALASAGFANQWGLPHAEVRAAWAARGVPLINTAEAGQISIHWTSPGEAFMLTTARP